MAKKAKKEAVAETKEVNDEIEVKQEKEKFVSSLDELYEKKFGDGVVVTGNYIMNSAEIIVPVSPNIDSMLGGGIKFGSFVIPTGPAKCGKTSFALNMAANALKIPTEWDKERRLYIFNIEGRLSKRDLYGVKALHPFIEEDRIHIIGSVPGRILHAENYLEMAEGYINEMPGSIFLIDSFSQLCSKKGKEKDWDDGKEFRDDVPKMLSMFCKRISNVIPINQSIVVGITHRIADTGFGFSSWAEASGTKIQYQVDVKLSAWSKDWKEGETTIGKEVQWTCHCSPLLNGACDSKCVSKLRYGFGIDYPLELLDACVDLGIVKKGGAWFTFPDGTKFQGAEKARNYLIEDETLMKRVNKEYREMMGLPNAGA